MDRVKELDLAKIAGINHPCHVVARTLEVTAPRQLSELEMHGLMRQIKAAFPHAGFLVRIETQREAKDHGREG